MNLLTLHRNSIMIWMKQGGADDVSRADNTRGVLNN